MKLILLLLSGTSFGAIATNFYYSKKSEAHHSANCEWSSVKNGLTPQNSAANIGIKTNPDNVNALLVNGDQDGISEGNAGMFTSSSLWHTTLAVRNTSVQQQWTMVTAGSANHAMQAKNFAIINTNLNADSKLSMVLDAHTNNVAFGFSDTYFKSARSTVTVNKGDVSIEQAAKGIILTAPNGGKWRVSIDNNGNFKRERLKNY